MIGRHMLLLTILLAATSLTLAISATRLRRAENLADAAIRSIDLAAADAQHVLDLQSRSARLGASKRPEQDLIAQVSETLAQAGIASDTLKTLAQQSDVQLNAQQTESQLPYRRQTIRFTLASIEPTQLGAFLEAWNARQGIWTPTRIELRHTGVANTFNADIHISATYIAEYETR